MALTIWGQVIIQAATPGEDPVQIGSIWVDTSGTPAVKTCTAVSPYTFASIGGGVTDGDKGDISVSGSGATWTIDNDVVTYAKMQNISATSRILARKTSGAGDPEEATLSEVLDFVGSAAQGDILYRGAASWARLAAGTAGQILKTGGSSANPSWTATALGLKPGGRLTLTSATPVTTSDVTGATTLYYTPYVSRYIEIYNGMAWVSYTFSEISLALGTLTSGLPYDVFIYDNSGTLTLELTAWTNDTTRATALARQDGIYVKTGATTRRYLGTIRTTSTTATEDSFAKRFVWNYYNRVPRPMRVLPTADTWTYSTPTFRQANNDTANQLDFVIGVSEDAVSAAVFAGAYSSATVDAFQVAIGLDSTTTPATGVMWSDWNFVAINAVIAATSLWNGFPGAGRHFLAWLEYSTGTGTTTWRGDGGATVQSGISGIVMG